MKKIYALIPPLSIFLLFWACKPDKIDTNSVNGLVQKGAFVIGSKIEIKGLSANFQETQQSASTTTVSDAGAFSFENDFSESVFLLATATGSYFNEVTEKVDARELTLRTLVDKNNTKQLNINVLTHLSVERIQYLVGQNIGFDEAKKKAQAEILSVFSIDEVPSDFEQMDIVKNGKGDAMLLAISAIFQGRNDVKKVADLLTKVSSDIKTDGTLDTPELQSALVNSAFLLNPSDIRAHLTRRMRAISLSSNIGDFEFYIENFIKKTKFKFSLKGQYPEKDAAGRLNLLALSDTVVHILSRNTDYTLLADVPTGLPLKVLVKGRSLSGGSTTLSTTIPNQGWNETFSFFSTEAILTLTATSPRVIAVKRFDVANYTLEIFEANTDKPTRVVKFIVPVLPSLTIRDTGNFGQNILAIRTSERLTKGDYSIQLDIDDAVERTVRLNIFYGGTSQATFSNVEGWVFKTESTNPASTNVSLTLKGKKIKGDVKMTLLSNGGFFNVTGTIDNSFQNYFSRGYSW